MDKVRGNTGETIVESLLSMLVIVLVFVFLTTAVITAARITSSAKTENVSLDFEGGSIEKANDAVNKAVVKVDGSEVHVQTEDGAEKPLDLYAVVKDGVAEYYYYEYSQANS